MLSPSPTRYSLIDGVRRGKKAVERREKSVAETARWLVPLPASGVEPDSIGARKKTAEEGRVRGERKDRAKKEEERKKKKEKKKNVGWRSYVGHWLPQLMLSISSWPTCVGVAVIVLANHTDFNIILPRATERERERELVRYCDFVASCRAPPLHTAPKQWANAFPRPRRLERKKKKKQLVLLPP